MSGGCVAEAKNRAKFGRNIPFTWHIPIGWTHVRKLDSKSMSGCSTGSQKVVSSKPTLPFCCHTHPSHLKQWELLNGWDELYICELILGRFFHSRGPVTASELRNCLFGTSGHIPLQLRRSTSNNLLEKHDVTLPKLLPQFQLSLFFEFTVLWSRDACFFFGYFGEAFVSSNLR